MVLCTPQAHSHILADHSDNLQSGTLVAGTAVVADTAVGAGRAFLADTAGASIAVSVGMMALVHSAAVGDTAVAAGTVIVAGRISVLVVHLGSLALTSILDMTALSVMACRLVDCAVGNLLDNPPAVAVVQHDPAVILQVEISQVHPRKFPWTGRELDFPQSG